MPIIKNLPNSKKNVVIKSVSSHTDAIHIGAKEIDGIRMTLHR